MSSRPENQAKKRKVWWSRLLIRLDYARKQTLLPRGMENGFNIVSGGGLVRKPGEHQRQRLLFRF